MGFLKGPDVPTPPPPVIKADAATAGIDKPSYASLVGSATSPIPPLQKKANTSKPTLIGGM